MKIIYDHDELKSGCAPSYMAKLKASPFPNYRMHDYDRPKLGCAPSYR